MRPWMGAVAGGLVTALIVGAVVAMWAAIFSVH